MKEGFLEAHNIRRKKHILYISFLGILEPVAFSQVFSYAAELSKDSGLRFTLLTFEKKEFLRQTDSLEYKEIRQSLGKNKLGWYILRHNRGLGKIYDLFRGFMVTLFLMLRYKIDIIHARSNEPVILAFFISRIFSRVKVIYDRRGIMADDYSDDANTNFRIKKGGFIYRFLEGFERRIMRSSDAIVVLTKKILNHITTDSYFRKRKNVFTIPCCVDMDRFDRFSKDSSPILSGLRLNGKFIINYTGSLYNIHCISEMLDFFKIAKRIIPDSHFMFLTLADRKMVERFIGLRKLDIRDFTIISTTPLRVNEYLSICDVSIMFFKPTFNKLAAAPTKLAESLASGLPVIINKGIGDTEEFIERNKVGAVVDNFSETTYKRTLDKLLKLLEEPDIRLRCREAAKSNLSLQYGAEKYRKIYQNV